jgi:sporulation protein YlmC with PRC-barrel domain
MVDQRWLPLSSLVGLEVLTEGGDRVGRIVDAELDDHTLAVTSYLLKDASGAWRRRGRIHPDEVISCSAELMLVRSALPK